MDASGAKFCKPRFPFSHSDAFGTREMRRGSSDKSLQNFAFRPQTE